MAVNVTCLVRLKHLNYRPTPEPPTSLFAPFA